MEDKDHPQSREREEITQQNPQKKTGWRAYWEDVQVESGSFGLRLVSYMFVATLASLLTFALVSPRQQLQRQDVPYTKLEELAAVIGQRFIGEADQKVMEDMAAYAMVDAIGDPWSFYIPAEDFASVMEQKENVYVGIGVTITVLEDNQGFQITRMEPDGPAEEGGIQIGDVIVGVDGARVSDVGAAVAQEMVGGEKNTQVTLTIRRGEQEMDVELTRRKIVQVVATGRMVDDNIGYIRIYNFNNRSASDTIELFEQLKKQGAEAMIFDVRFNPGGYKSEMVELLDYLLPQGVLFRSEDYRGVTTIDESDAKCQNMPMAVLINGDSYSAAEFFAAALKEYDYAVTVGQPTTGKGYFQHTISLSDGSAVNLSVGKYYTPNGVSLAEVGGLVPDVTVEVDLETMTRIYNQEQPDEEDEQLQAAIGQLTMDNDPVN